MPETYKYLLFLSHEPASILETDVYKELEKSKSAVPSFSRYLAGVICKFRLNSWNTKYSENLTCVCKNVLSVSHVLLECPITTVVLEKFI